MIVISSFFFSLRLLHSVFMFPAIWSNVTLSFLNGHASKGHSLSSEPSSRLSRHCCVLSNIGRVILWRKLITTTTISFPFDDAAKWSSRCNAAWWKLPIDVSKTRAADQSWDERYSLQLFHLRLTTRTPLECKDGREFKRPVAIYCHLGCMYCSVLSYFTLSVYLSVCGFLYLKRSTYFFLVVGLIFHS